MALAAGITSAAAAGEPAETEPTESELGRSVAGRPIVVRVYEPTSGEADETLLVVASIHGSEPAGTPLVGELEKWLASGPEEVARRRIAIVPIANPDGYADRERHNQRGVDLNRNFPAGNRVDNATHGGKALSEPESRALMRVLKPLEPDRVVSIHQPLECIDYDGPGADLAAAMSEAIDGRLPVEKLGGRPGSMGSYVGITLGRPIITLELPKGVEQQSAERLWADYGPALVAFVRGE
ncbi:MAG: DUF2817 domain-containing protein [Planctomycetota bacterium]